MKVTWRCKWSTAFVFSQMMSSRVQYYHSPTFSVNQTLSRSISSRSQFYLLLWIALQNFFTVSYCISCCTNSKKSSRYSLILFRGIHYLFVFLLFQRLLFWFWRKVSSYGATANSSSPSLRKVKNLHLFLYTLVNILAPRVSITSNKVMWHNFIQNNSWNLSKSIRKWWSPCWFTRNLSFSSYTKSIINGR